MDMKSLTIAINSLQARVSNSEGLFDTYIDMKKEKDKLKKYLDKNGNKRTD